MFDPAGAVAACCQRSSSTSETNSMCASMASAAASASWFRMGPGRRRRHHGWGPPFVGPKDGRQSTYFMSCKRNKDAITLDLKSGDGQAVLRSARTW